ncbi:MAG: response regulator [Verrucomicrobia bacterium]|nr:response regulator [Verrucomicrobiota bacterium]
MPTKFKSGRPEGTRDLVLLVDDHAAVRDLTQMMLTTHGYRVLVAADGTEALALHAQQAERIKLVLTDLRMPNMDGLALIHALRQVAPALKIIASAGLDRNDTGQLEQLRALDVHAILHKPYTIDELLDTVKKALANTDR